MEYIDPVIVENNEHSAYVIAASPTETKVALHITPELEYSRTSYYGVGPYWCVLIVYDTVEDIFMFNDKRQRDKLRDLLQNMQMLRYRIPDSEWPSYTYTVTVRPRLTEHEGFDPDYVRDKMTRLIPAGCDKELSFVEVKRA